MLNIIEADFFFIEFRQVRCLAFLKAQKPCPVHLLRTLSDFAQFCFQFLTRFGGLWSIGSYAPMKLHMWQDAGEFMAMLMITT